MVRNCLSKLATLLKTKFSRSLWILCSLKSHSKLGNKIPISGYWEFNNAWLWAYKHRTSVQFVAILLSPFLLVSFLLSVCVSFFLCLSVSVMALLFVFWFFWGGQWILACTVSLESIMILCIVTDFHHWSNIMACRLTCVYPQNQALVRLYYSGCQEGYAIISRRGTVREKWPAAGADRGICKRAAWDRLTSRHAVTRGLWGHAPPENFEIKEYISCILVTFEDIFMVFSCDKLYQRY